MASFHTALQKNLKPSNVGFSNKWVKEIVCPRERHSPPTSTNDWQKHTTVTV